MICIKDKNRRREVRTNEASVFENIGSFKFHAPGLDEKFSSSDMLFVLRAYNLGKWLYLFQGEQNKVYISFLYLEKAHEYLNMLGCLIVVK